MANMTFGVNIIPKNNTVTIGNSDNPWTIVNPKISYSINMGRKANTIPGANSTALGYNVEANASYSQATGNNTIANRRSMSASGMYNVPDNYALYDEWMPNTEYTQFVSRVKVTEQSSVFGYMCIESHTSGDVFDYTKWGQFADGTFAEVVGNGSADNSRSNARALDWEGNERLKGTLYVQCNADSTGGAAVLASGCTWGDIAGASGN